MPHDTIETSNINTELSLHDAFEKDKDNLNPSMDSDVERVSNKFMYVVLSMSITV